MLPPGHWGSKPLSHTAQQHGGSVYGSVFWSIAQFGIGAHCTRGHKMQIDHMSSVVTALHCSADTYSHPSFINIQALTAKFAQM